MPVTGLQHIQFSSTLGNAAQDKVLRCAPVGLGSGEGPQRTPPSHLPPSPDRAVPKAAVGHHCCMVTRLVHVPPGGHESSLQSPQTITWVNSAHHWTFSPINDYHPVLIYACMSRNLHANKGLTQHVRKPTSASPILCYRRGAGHCLGARTGQSLGKIWIGTLP